MSGNSFCTKVQGGRGGGGGGFGYITERQTVVGVR